MDKQITVRELNSYIKNSLENDSILSNLWIKGEISNLKKAMSGHVYFTLKDEYAAVSVALFKSYAQGINFNLQDGQEIIIRGKVSIYEKTGSYQLYAKEVQEIGLGNIYQQIEYLKEKLLKEGIFEVSHKKPLPDNISSIGIVTSSKGAVLHDIKKVVGQRNPFVELIIYPVAVQGKEAPGEIAKGIRIFNSYKKVDVIIVARGGGSLEDLMAFNSEEVVRAVYASAIPVISAVGHETDTTLIDYVADIRGATPSQGGEIATVNIRERLIWLKNILIKNENKIKNKIEDYYQDLDLKGEKLLGFLVKLEEYQDKLISQFQTLTKKLIAKTELEKLKINHLGEKLHLISPLQLLNKGYSIAYDEAGEIVKREKQVAVKEKVKIKLYDGTLNCVVEGKE